ncbi:MAG: hypothetical protein QY323_02345 [Patescibacteria group bacterium]|nr:MAG: hypothetical protein QY323_02345 [Patescibacteria group bacterium]
MKAGAFFWALLWFGASMYAGYRLTEYSFAWIGEPNFGVESAIDAETRPPRIPEAIREGLPPEWQEQAKNLTPKQILCLQASIKPSRVQAVLAGQFTAEEAAAVQTCLK